MLQDAGVQFELQSHPAETRERRTGERFVYAPVVDLAYTVAAHEVVVKEHTHFTDIKIASDEESTSEVLHRIVDGLLNRDLSPGDDYGLCKITESEGECSGRIRKSVCAMQNDETIVVRIVSFHISRQLDPLSGVHVRAVQQWRVLVDVERGKCLTGERGMIANVAFEKVRLGHIPPTFRITLHAECATRVENEDTGISVRVIS
mmetsp:Transcript_12324/g.31271  ORF Transcript_12324/g.31271 Transcript_12324/m.31271 type:complete len:204 (-) Transcript_12324:541-1152(-)